MMLTLVRCRCVASPFPLTKWLDTRANQLGLNVGRIVPFLKEMHASGIAIERCDFLRAMNTYARESFIAICSSTGPLFLALVEFLVEIRHFDPRKPIFKDWNTQEARDLVGGDLFDVSVRGTSGMHTAIVKDGQVQSLAHAFPTAPQANMHGFAHKFSHSRFPIGESYEAVARQIRADDNDSLLKAFAVGRARLASREAFMQFLLADRLPGPVTRFILRYD